MTREELREAVARAIDNADQTLRPLPEWRLALADAALAAVRDALREPTMEMLKAAHHEEEQCAIHNYGGSPRVEDIWAIMLAASSLGGGDE
jgi:hypothetical protein